MAEEGASTSSSIDSLVLGTRCELLPSASTTSGGLRASLRREGRVAYVGPVRGLPAGEWIGVRLERPLGKGDGSLGGERYFDAAPLHAAFVRRERLHVLPEAAAGNEDAATSVAAAGEGEETSQEKQETPTDSSRELRVDELAQRFWRGFSAQEADVRAQLAAFTEQKQQQQASASLTTAAGGGESRLDALVLRVGEMRAEAAAAAGAFLSPYDVRQTQLIVAKLLELVEATRSAVAPRKKFTFRARAKREAAAAMVVTTDENKNANNTSSSSTSDDTPEKKHLSIPAVADASKSNQPLDLDELVHANLQGRVIVVDQTSFAAGDNPHQRRDLSFSHLTNCAIFVRVATSAIRCDALTNCVVFAGPVWGSVWLESCHASAFFVACRQLRVHRSRASSFHLRISSHPIIEDCSELSFGPYRLSYDGLDEQLESIALREDSGLWARVNDFKWHKAQQSPNWSVRDPKQPLPAVPAALAGRLALT